MRRINSCAWTVMLLLLLCVPATAAEYTIDDQGVITAPDTGLQWFVGPAELTWDQAVAFCKDLDVDGGNWRMPTMAELQSLFTGQENWSTHNSLPPVFQGKELEIMWVWANETKGSQEACFIYFYNGLKSWDRKDFVAVNFRVFAVREK